MAYGKGMPWYIPSLTFQPRKVAELLVSNYQDKTVVDLGSGGRRIAPWVKTVDAVQYPNTDFVCNFVKGETPFQSNSVDLVICTGVLEHVEDDRLFMREIKRILRNGGIAHIEVPFLQQYHEDPIDCRRFTLPGLKLYLEKHGFQILNHGVHIGPTVTILTLFSHYIDLLFNANNLFSKLLSNGLFVTFSVIAWPLRYLDIWLIKRAKAHRLAFGVYATAAKSGE